MRPGSEEHKELFCRSFIETRAHYEPERLDWPELAEKDLAMLRALPIWDTLWQVERNAGVMVTAFAKLQPDSLVREALEVQGYEEERHGRLIGEMVRRYDLPAKSVEPEIVPTEQAFIDFGCGECIDSFIGFGVFKLARDAGFMPDALFAIFARVLSEEARHITFFVNWLAYERARHPLSSRPRYFFSAARGYATGVRKVIGNGRMAATAAPQGDSGFAGDDVFAGLTLTRVLESCIGENDRLMSAFDPGILRPKLMPRIARTALAVARFSSRLRGRNRRDVEEVKEEKGRGRAQSGAGEDLQHGVGS